MEKRKLKVNIGLKSIILIVAAIILLAADLLTKHFAMEEKWMQTIIPGWVEINAHVSKNSGIAFGLFNDNPQICQPILITLTIVMVIGLIFVFAIMPERFTVLKVAVALIVSGAIGNLVDRCIFMSEINSGILSGGVRDWFGLRMFGHLTYCNFADFWIVIGAAVSIIDLLFFNEWALIPLTRAAKEAQAERKDAENKEKTQANIDFEADLQAIEREEKERDKALIEILYGETGRKAIDGTCADNGEQNGNISVKEADEDNKNEN